MNKVTKLNKCTVHVLDNIEKKTIETPRKSINNILLQMSSFYEP